MPLNVYSLRIVDFVPIDTTYGHPIAIDAFPKASSSVPGDTVATVNPNKGYCTVIRIGAGEYAQRSFSTRGTLPQDVKVFINEDDDYRLLISNAGEDSVRLFNSWGVQYAIAYVAEYPMGMDIAPYHDGEHVAYIACRDSRSVKILSLETFTIMDTFDDVGTRPVDILTVINPSRDTLVYVVNNIPISMQGEVHVLDLDGNPIDTIYVGGGPVDIDHDPNEEYVYTANSLSGTVSCILTTTNEVRDTIDLQDPQTQKPATPMGIAINHFQIDYGFVTNSNYNEIVRFTIPDHEIDERKSVYPSDGPIGIVITDAQATLE